MSITKADIIAGGKTIIATLTNDTFVVANVTPVIAYVGGQVGGRAGATSTLAVNFALTGGLAAVPAAGDLVIISMTVGSVARNPAQAVSGYTALGQLNSAAATNDTSNNVSYKFMGGTPDTSFTAPSTGNIADAQSWTVQVFRNVDATTPMDVTSTTATGSATGRPNPAAITPITAGAVVVICGSGCAATGANYTAPANYTTNFLTRTDADTTDSMVGSGYRAWTSGAEDPAVFTGGTTNAADSWTARTIALRPVAPTTPFATARAAARDGITSAQSEAAGWNVKVRPNIPVGNIVRTSNTVCTVTLQAQADYNITANDVVTWTIPGSILASGNPIVATPTFTVTPGVAAYSLDAGPGSYAVAGVAAGAVSGRMANAVPGAYAVAGVVAGAVVGRALNAVPGAYVVAGSVAGAMSTRMLNAVAGAYTVTGVAAGVMAGRMVNAAFGTYAVEGSVANLVFTAGLGVFSLNAAPGAYAVTGFVAGTLADRVLNAAAGGYTVTGLAAALIAHRVLSAALGTYAVAGVDAGLVKVTPTAYFIDAAPGVYTISGLDAGLLHVSFTPPAGMTEAERLVAGAIYASGSRRRRVFPIRFKMGYGPLTRKS